MSRLRAILILAAGLLLSAALVLLVLHERQARLEGKVVALALQGVDPRNLLSGHYVALNFAQELRPQEMCPVTLSNPPDVSIGWVALSPRGDPEDNLWQATGMAVDRATAARLGVVTVRGSALCDPRGEGHVITLEIAINRFHASQAEAERLTRLIGLAGGEGPPAQALVSIGKDGRDRLSGLRVGAERVMLDW
jgi:hypothetical protein